MDNSIYAPNEDSILLKNCIIKNLKSSNKDLRILEIGCGSGFQLKGLRELGFKNLFGTDINSKAVQYCKDLGFECIKSNLFENINKKFNIIIFNPPYLPLDKNEPKDSQLATTGGKNGGEIISKFLEQAENFIEENGKIFLLTSNLTKGINWGLWKRKKIGNKKLFFEELYVWEIYK